MTTTKPFKIAIAGLGTVGAGVVKLLGDNVDIITARAGRSIEIVAVSARNKTRDRGVDLSDYDWVDNAPDLAARNDIDAVVELIGGADKDTPAYKLVSGALKAGKHVVTANKALLAHHGGALAADADNSGVNLCFEAAVAGGIPAIKSLRDGLTANTIRSVYGILNGTCNYILTEMRRTSTDFDDVLKDAQTKGYAEADPAFDIGGTDTAHKICLLAALAFGTQPALNNIDTSGIENITADDIGFADDFGFKIKLLGAAKIQESGALSVNVSPCMIPASRPIASVDGVYNAVLIDSDYAGKTLLIGRGAGAYPTASAVVADIIDLARGIKLPTFNIPATHLKMPKIAPSADITARYYIRFMVHDEVGVLADISAILCDNSVSIKGLIQRQRDRSGGLVPVVMTTHRARAGDIKSCAALIADLNACNGAPCIIRIEDEI